MSFEKSVIQILDDAHPYVYRDIVFQCYRLKLECGHITHRERLKEKVVCVECYQKNKKIPSGSQLVLAL